jgi:hypothetical protein
MSGQHRGSLYHNGRPRRRLDRIEVGSERRGCGTRSFSALP